MTATCHEPGCPLSGVPVPVPDDATRVVCGGCQHVVTDVGDEPAPKRRKGSA